MQSADRGSSLLDLLHESTSTIVLESGECISTQSILERGRALAAELELRGLLRGDRVGIWMSNGRDYLDALTACGASGLVAVSVNTRYSADEAAALLGRSGAKHTFVDAASAAIAPDHIGLIHHAHGTVPASGGTFGPDPRPDDAFIIFTTSGTTSQPKMVMHHQRSLVAHARDVAIALPIRPDDVTLIAMPLCGVFGLVAFTSAIAAGATIVLPSSFSAVSTAELIAEHQVTILHGSDDMFHRLLEVDADISTIRIGGYAKFNTSLDGIVKRCDAAGADLVGLYGMSEVQALFAARSPDDKVEARSLGGGSLVSERAAYRVVDGELQLKGPSMFAGYLEEGGKGVDRTLTDAAFDRDWFRTGDLAEPESDRSFTYLARMGDVLRLGGFLVAPSEIEQTLTEVEGINEAQVVAVDRPTGSRPVAFVTATGEIDERLAITHCRDRLARYKVPVRVVKVLSFPVTESANGTKIQKSKLRAMAESLPDFNS